MIDGGMESILILTYEVLDTEGGGVVTCLQGVNHWHRHNYVHTRIILTNAAETEKNYIRTIMLRILMGKTNVDVRAVRSSATGSQLDTSIFDELRIKLFGICG